MNKCPRSESEILKMNRREVLEKAIELKSVVERFGEVTITPPDVEFFMCLVEELRGATQEESVQERLAENENIRNVSLRGENGVTKVTVDGKEVRGIKKATFIHEAGKVPVVSLEVYPKIVTIDSNLLFEVNDFFGK